MCFSKEGSVAFIRVLELLLKQTNKQTRNQLHLKICLSRKCGSGNMWKNLCLEAWTWTWGNGRGGVGKKQHEQREGQEACREQPFFWVRYWGTVWKQIERVGWSQIVRRIKVQTSSCWQFVPLKTFEQVMTWPANGECSCNVEDELLRRLEMGQLECVHCCGLNVFQTPGGHSVNICWPLLGRQI